MSYSEPPIPGVAGTKASVNIRATLSWTMSAAGSLAAGVQWRLSKLDGTVTETGTTAAGTVSDCTATLGLNPKDAIFRGGISQSGASGYTVTPPSGIPFGSVVVSAHGSAPVCSQANWASADAWGTYQTFPKAATSGTLWFKAIAPSLGFPGGAHTGAVDYAYTCNSSAGCEGVESQGKFYGSSTLDVQSRLTLNAPG